MKTILVYDQIPQCKQTNKQTKRTFDIHNNNNNLECTNVASSLIWLIMFLLNIAATD